MYIGLCIYGFIACMSFYVYMFKYMYAYVCVNVYVHL